MAHVRKWTPLEIEYIKKNYLTDVGHLSKKMERTEEDISYKMYSLGIIKEASDAPGWTFNIFDYSNKVWDNFMSKLRKKFTLKKLTEIHNEQIDPSVKYSELYELCVIIQDLRERIETLECNSI